MPISLSGLSSSPFGYRDGTCSFDICAETRGGPSCIKAHSSSAELATDGSQGIPAREQAAAGGRGRLSKREILHCPFCPYISYYMGPLNVHLRKHSGEKPFKCSLCNAAFAYSATYKRHMSLHTGEKPFKCDLCPFVTAHSESLAYHRTTHASREALMCKICSSACANKGSLVAHMRAHARDKERATAQPPNPTQPPSYEQQD